MKYLVLKDKKRRFFNICFELEKIRLKSIIYNRKISKKIRIFFCFKIARLARNSSKVRLKNRCLVTGRSQSVYRLIKLNRVSLKEQMSFGRIHLMRKASW